MRETVIAKPVLKKRGRKTGAKLLESRLIGEAKMQRILQLIVYISSGKRELQSIQDRFDISQRTAYRYVDLIESLGLGVEKDFNGRIFIVSNTCPLCGSKEK